MALWKSVFTLKAAAIAAALCLSAIASSPARAEPPGPDDKALEDCQSYRPARAIRGCTTLLDRSGPGEIRGGMRANVLTNRSESRLSEGEAAGALEDADKAIALDARNDRAFAARGRALVKLGRDAEAIAPFTSAISLDQRTVSVLIERGRAYARLMRDPEAEADFREAIRRRYNRPEPYLAHAEFLQDRAQSANDLSSTSPRMAEAKRELDKAIEYGLAFAPAYAGRARWHELAGDDKAALADLGKAIDADETFGLAYLERGRLNARLGDDAAAKADAAQAVFTDGGKPEVVAFARSLGVPTVTPAQTGLLAETGSKSPEPPTADAAPKDKRPRIALVIGNGTYKDPENALPNALNDARDVGAKLAELGFEVMTAYDQPKAELTGTIEDFSAKAASASAALVYYAGHGIGENGRSFVVPVDADLARVDDPKGELIDVAKIVFDVERVAPLVLVFLDACRTPPSLARPADPNIQVASASTRAPERSRALSAIKTAGQETLMVYATTPGRTAADGVGRNSPFTRSFLANVGAPGVEVQSFVKRITRDVRQATANRQSPESVAQMSSDFYFVSAAK